MPSVPEAIDALRTALHKKGVESHVQDAFNHLASCLNSSSPSAQMIRKLCTVLRQPLLPLYNACLQPALQLSSSVLSTVLGKLCDAHNVEDGRLRAAWDATAEVILSGVLDFLDQKDGGNVESDGAVWEALYRIICDFFFLDSSRGLPAFSIPLYLSAYNTLSEIAARQITIRDALRHSAVFGGERLGAAISRSRDYLLLEALLMLFARLLPPIHNTSQGKVRRIQFVKEVLGSPKLFKCSAELLDIMQGASGTHWDDVAAQIIDAIAMSDITYPQPFSIDKIDVCGRVFPQPLATDRLIMDKQAFLVNVVAESDDLCESLQVPYSYIRTITLDNSEQNVPNGKVLIMVYLTSPPLVANAEMKSPGGNHLYAKFMLQNDSVGRFMEALRRRGVGKLNFLNPLTRVQRKRKSISIGSGFKFVNDSSPIPPPASFEGKVQHVNQVYKTDIEDSTTSAAVPVPRIGDMCSSLPLDLKPAFKDKNLVPEVLESAVAEDVPATLKSARLISLTTEAPKPIQNPKLSFSPGNLIRSIHLPGDTDELSEISEFEPDHDTADKRAATRVSTSCNHELEPTQRKIDRTWTNGSPGVTSTIGIKKSPEPVSKKGDRSEGVAQRSPGTGKALLSSDSPVFDSSSSTQINVSPKDTLLTTAVTGVADGLSPGADHKVHPRVEITKDTSIPPKIAGSRRKRETIKSSSKAIIEIDDDSTPPHKKSRNDKHGTEDKAKSNQTLPDATSISRVTRYTESAKGPSPDIDLTAVGFDALQELKSTYKGTRRSSRIKKRQIAATGGTRANAMRGKAQRGKQTAGQSTGGMKRKKSITVSLQDTGVGISYGTPSTSRLAPSLVRESPFPKINNHIPLVELRSTENITSKTSSPRKMLKASSIPCESSQPSPTPVKEPLGGFGFVNQTPSDAMQLVEGQFHIKTEETIDDQRLVSDLRTIDGDIIRAQEVVEYSASLGGSGDPVPSRPITELITRTETEAIDIIIDNSPTREKSELHKTFVDRVRPKADIQTKSRTSDQSDRTAIGKPAFDLSPRHRRRSVTFASPIESVLDKNVKSTTQLRSSGLVACSFPAGRSQHVAPDSIYTPRSRRSPSPCESSTLSPRRTPTGTVDVKRESPDRITPRATLQKSRLSQAYIKAPVHNQIADEVGIQDIVEVINEIQAVIIQGISDKFRNIKKDAQRGRDELIQQVLDELQGMVVENAKHFNGLVRLEEDYYKNGRGITRCWEELIDCNDGIAVQFQNALKEHDQNVSASSFPKSLLPLQPVFLRRRANA